jgi:hypothetical protein
VTFSELKLSVSLVDSVFDVIPVDVVLDNDSCVVCVFCANDSAVET